MRDCPHPDKIYFGVKEQAKRRIKTMTGIAGRDGLRAYKCRCGGWHIGHKKPSWVRNPPPPTQSPG